MNGAEKTLQARILASAAEAEVRAACLHSTARSWHRLAQREGSSLPVPVTVPAQPAGAQPELTLFQIDREVQSAMFSSPEATAAPRAAMATGAMRQKAMRRRVTETGVTRRIRQRGNGFGSRPRQV